MKALISDLAHRAARRWGDTQAVAVTGGRSLSFNEIDRLSGCLAGSLLARGIRQGDHVLLHLPNGWQWIVAYHAIARLGCVVIPANILLSAAEVGYMAVDAEARAIFLPADRLGAIDASGLLAITTGETVAGGIDFDAMIEGEWVAPADIDPHALLAIGYTSGTTGKPKGAMLSHANVFASVADTATTHVRHAGDRVYSALPLPHVYGNVVMNASMLAGSRLFTSERFDAASALRAIADEGITLFEGVPTMYYQMLAAPATSDADLSSLTRCTVGGQTMPVAKIEAVVARFGCPLLELWGMTEVGGPAVSHSPFWPMRPGSIGRPFAGTEVRIADLDDPDIDVDDGEPGELLIRGPLVMSGYWNRPDATAETIDAHGWLATGDVARQDPDGYLYVVDRKKDVILTAGYNVYPAELEQAIAAHPAVAMVAVAGAPCETKGEIAQAFVVLQPGAALDEDMLLAHCRTLLAAYKVPRTVHFVDELPRNSTGKILRRALRESAAAPLPQL